LKPFTVKHVKEKTLPPNCPMLSSFRWFGPDDPVSLAAIRQCGCDAVFTALHEVPAGECWTRAAIRERRTRLADHGLAWVAAESVPVTEAIKTRTGDWAAHIRNYCRSIENLAAEGIHCVIYNFMPVLDWVRTDLSVTLPDGARTVGLNPVRLAAFDAFILKRPGAAADYPDGLYREAEAVFSGLDEARITRLQQDIIDIFPGRKTRLHIEDIRSMMKPYANLGRERLQSHLADFLKEIIPVAESVGVRLAVHPDDPPYPVLGLPRIVSTQADLEFIIGLSDSPANGFCFCPGSLGVIPENEPVSIARRFADRIHAVHLRNITRSANGGFTESPLLEGSVDIPDLVRVLLGEQNSRRAAGRDDWRLPMRPDHGLVILEDLRKPPPTTPGYTCLGRMKSLAELRGLQSGMS
jgi:mannonate dehydratase